MIDFFLALLSPITFVMAEEETNGGGGGGGIDNNGENRKKLSNPIENSIESMTSNGAHHVVAGILAQRKYSNNNKIDKNNDENDKKFTNIEESSSSSCVAIMDFDQFLPYIGDCGRYQLLIFSVMIPFCFFFAFVYFAQMFITLVPEKYYCHVPELDIFNLTEEER